MKHPSNKSDMKLSLINLLIFILMLAILSGCASTTSEMLDEVDSVTVCLNGTCGPAVGKYSADELTGSLYVMFKANENSEALLCGTEEGSQVCSKEAIGWFVQGGPMPGKATMKKPVPLQVRLDKKPNASTMRWMRRCAGSGHRFFAEMAKPALRKYRPRRSPCRVSSAVPGQPFPMSGTSNTPCG